MEQSLFAGLSWCALIAGLFILFQALLADRARGRRRCPKCWYDLSRTIGRRCPECGHDAKRERVLYRTRRRWRLAIVGVLVLIVSHPVARVPAARAHGAAAFAPDWLLVAVLPWYEESIPVPTAADPTATTLSWPFAEIHHRLDEQSFTWLGKRLLAERAIAGDAKRPLHLDVWSPYWQLMNEPFMKDVRTSKSVASRFGIASTRVIAETRTDWPAGQPIYAYFALYSGFEGDLHARLDPVTPGLESREIRQYRSSRAHHGCCRAETGRQPIGTPPAGTTELKYNVVISELLSSCDETLRLGETIGEVVLTVPINVQQGGSLPLVLEPDDQFARAIGATGIAALYEDCLSISYPPSAANLLAYAAVSPDGSRESMIFGCRIQLLDGRSVVAEVTDFRRAHPHYGEPDLYFDVDRAFAEHAHSLVNQGREPRVRVEFDPAIALRDPRAVQSIHGSFELPLYLEARPSNAEEVFALERRVLSALAQRIIVHPDSAANLMIRYDAPADDPIPTDGVMHFRDANADLLINGRISEGPELDYLVISPTRVIGELSNYGIMNDGSARPLASESGVVRIREWASYIADRAYEFRVTQDSPEDWDPWFLIEELELRYAPTIQLWPWERAEEILATSSGGVDS